jgi:hypothetical protein
MFTRSVAILGVVAMWTVATAAQQPPARPAPRGNPPRAAAPAPAPAAPPAVAAPAPQRAAAPPAQPAQLVNIRIEVAVSEDGGNQPAGRKVTSLTLADRQSGSVRAMGTVPPAAPGEMPVVAPRMFVDAFPMMQRDGRVQVQLTLEYGRPGATSVRVEPLLESGKPLVVSESVDPFSDRRTRVELTATILK